jgi:hypothetical protein
MDTVNVPADLWNEIVEFIEGQVDVVDGSYGVPHANRAMQLQQEIEERGL